MDMNCSDSADLFLRALGSNNLDYVDLVKVVYKA